MDILKIIGLIVLSQGVATGYHYDIFWFQLVCAVGVGILGVLIQEKMAVRK